MDKRTSVSVSHTHSTPHRPPLHTPHKPRAAACAMRQENKIKIKKPSHTHRQMCTNLFPSIALLDVPEDHGREKHNKTKSAKSWVRNVDQRHEGPVGPETQKCDITQLFSRVMACLVCNDLRIIENWSVTLEVTCLFFCSASQSETRIILTDLSMSWEDWWQFKASQTFSQNRSLWSSSEQT